MVLCENASVGDMVGDFERTVNVAISALHLRGLQPTLVLRSLGQDHYLVFQHFEFRAIVNEYI